MFKVYRTFLFLNFFAYFLQDVFSPVSTFELGGFALAAHAALTFAVEVVSTQRACWEVEIRVGSSVGRRLGVDLLR
jgi:hypothetical protein